MSCYPILSFERRTVAVILCGGMSQRMGQDKGLISKGNTTWAEHLKGICENLGLEAFISINRTQLPTYKKIIDPALLLVDKFEDYGPLGGFLSAYQHLLECDFLFLSCDMQMLDEEILLEYLNEYESLGEFDIVAYFDGRYYQPFPALISNEFMKSVSNLYIIEPPQVKSLQQMYNCGNVKSLSLPDQSKEKLRSFNNIEDLDDLSIK